MMRSLWFLILLLAACGPTTTSSGGGDDDDATGAADDDDAVADDDDTAPVDVECDDATLEPIIEAIRGWELLASCTTARLSLAPADGANLLSFRWLLEQETIAVGNSWALYFDGAEPGDAVLGTQGLQRGTDLMANECRANPTGNPVVNETWTFTEGSVRVTVTGTGTGSGWQADVALVDAVMTRDASTETCEVPDVVWSDVTFGLPPS